MAKTKTKETPRLLETWIPHADGTATLETVYLDHVWMDEFARWDSVVPTDLAAQIASAVHERIEAWIAKEGS